MSEGRLESVKVLRFYELADSFGQPVEVVRRALQLGFVSAARPVTPKDADRIRQNWVTLPEAKVLAIAAAYRDECYDDEIAFEYEHRKEDAPDRLTAKDIEYRFDVQLSTIRKWVQRGYLTPVGSVGRAHIYNRSDVERVQQETAGRSKSYKFEGVRGAQPAVANPSISGISSRRDQSRVLADQMLDSTEAANLVAVATSTIRVWVNRGHLHPAGRVGRKHLYRALDVLGAARSRRTAGSRV